MSLFSTRTIRAVMAKAPLRRWIAMMVIAFVASAGLVVQKGQSAQALNVTSTITTGPGGGWTSDGIERDQTVSPDGRYWYVSTNYGISVIDSQSKTQVGYLSTNAAIKAFQWKPDGSVLYGFNGYNLLVINTTTITTPTLTTTVSVGTVSNYSTKYGMQISSDGAYLYAASYASGTSSLFKINTSTYAVSTVATDGGAGHSWTNVMLNPAGTVAYLGGLAPVGGSNYYITPVNLSNGTLGTGIYTAISPSAKIFNSDKSIAYVYSAWSVAASFYKLDLNTGTLSSAISTNGLHIRATALSPDGATLYLAGDNASYLPNAGFFARYNTGTLTQIGSNATIGIGSNAMAISADNQRAFISRDTGSSTNGELIQVNLAVLGYATPTVSSGWQPYGVFLSSDSLTAFTFNRQQGTVTVAATPYISPSKQNLFTTYGQPSPSYAAPVAYGLSGTVTWSTSDTLPAGLVLNSSTGVISGIATGGSSGYFNTIWLTATGSVSGTVSGWVTIRVMQLTPATQTVNAYAGQAITSTTAYTAAGLSTPVSYAISPALPVGLSMNTSTGVISGTPRLPQDSRTYTVTATGALGDSETATVTIQSGLVTPQNIQYIAGVAGTPITPSSVFTGQFISGTPSWTVSSGTLPTGLALDSTSGVISGTPTTAADRVQITLKWASPSGDVLRKIEIGIASPGKTVSNPGPITATIGTAISPVTLSSSGFSSTPTYGVFTPPSSIGNASGVISGTPGQPIGAAGVNAALVSKFLVRANYGTEYAYTVASVYLSSVGASISLPSSITLGQNQAMTPTAAPAVSGLTGPIGYWVSPSLPAGLTMNALTGVISGTPTMQTPATTYTVTAIGSNATLDVATTTFSLAVTGTLSPATQTVYASPNISIADTSTFAITGLVGTPTYAISPALPAGLSISSSTGVITGTPADSQALTSYTVTAIGATSGTATATVNIGVAGISPAAATVRGVKGSAITSTTAFTETSFVGSVTYSVSPSLPTGLAFNTSTGVISGTPTVSQNQQTYTVTATGATSGVATASVALSIAELPPATTSVQGTVGTAITSTTAFSPVGLTAPITYSVSPTLPTGLAFNTSTGVISGTPTVASSSTYTVTATDTNSVATSTTLTIQIAGLSPATQTRSIQLGAAISDTTALTPTGFTGAVSYSVSPSVAAGLSFNTGTGVISGTPTVALAGQAYTITATGATAGVATATVTVTVAALNPDAQSLTMMVGSAAQTQTLTPSGFTGAVSYSVSPSLPTGLALNTSTGVISGTPTAAQGSTDYTITASGAVAGQATTVVSLAVRLKVAPDTQNIAAQVNKAITPTSALTVSGGSGTTVFSVSPGLPTGMSINPSTGVVSGTPTASSASATYLITATDSVVAAKVGTSTLVIAVDAATVGLAPTSQSVLGAANSAITATTPFTPTGLVGAVSYAVSPDLPSGLTLNASSGVVSGTPTNAQPATSYLITATGATSGRASATINISVSSSSATMTPAQQTLNGRVGTAITSSSSFSVAGLTGAVAFSVSPALPAGLSLNSSTGVISGTPTTATAALPYVITATGATSGTVSANVTLGIASTTAAVANASQVIQASSGQAITATAPLDPTGLTGTATYSISPQLPAGMSFNPANGVISGTPLTPLSGVTFTVTASGATSGIATGIVTLTVATSGASVSTPTQAVITPAGSAITPTVAPTTTGMTGPFTYFVSPALPAGLVLNTTTGVISGTPTSGIPATEFAVTVVDSNGAIASFSTVIAVSSSGTTASPATQQSIAAAGTAMASTAPVSTTGLSGTARFTVTPVLPAGLVLDPATGVISGTPTAGFAATVFTITGAGATSGVVSVPVTLSGNSSGATVSPATANITGTANTAVTPSSVLTVTGVGSNPVFTALPELPAGLSLNAGTGVVSGTPTATQAAQSYLISATGSSGVVHHQLTIAVSSAGAALTPATQTISGQTGNAITATSALTASGLTGSASYAVSPALPAGLSLNASTGVISGTPTSTQVTSAFVITGSGATSGIATSVVTITVAGISPSTQTVQGSVGQALTATTAFAAVGISGALTYTVSTALPAGLALNASTGVISGTPTTSQSSATYTVTGTGSVAGSAAATVSIQIAGLSPATQTAQATYGSAMTATSSLTPTGFTGAVSYAVSPALPTGLSLNSSTGVISGTPTQSLASSNFVITATGATAGTATASLNLGVAAIAPTAPTGVVVTMARGQAVVSWTAGDSGGSSVTYTVTANPGGFTCTTTQTSCVVPGLVAGTNYTFSVVAGSSAGLATPAPSSPTVAPAMTVPQNVPSATLGSTLTVSNSSGQTVTSMEIGRTYTVTGTGFAPNSEVTLLFYSTPTQVGTVTTNAQGSFTTTVLVPSTLATGSHHLVALGVNSNAADVNAVVSVTVSERSEATDLANTGSTTFQLLAISFILLLLGISLVIRRRKAGVQ